MEKIMRKVKCSERLPSKSKYYYTEIGELMFNGRIFLPRRTETMTRPPEYWYEEVHLLEAFKDAYDMEIVKGTKGLEMAIGDVAKERYEKANEYLTIKSLFPTTALFEKALKIAAGLKEE